MVLEFYCNLTVALRVGPHILATYGLFTGVTGVMIYMSTTLYLEAFEVAELGTFGDKKTLIGSTVVCFIMLGYRICSMQIEDAHELARGHFFRALLRPGFLEAGGHTFLTLFGAFAGLCFPHPQGHVLIPSVLLCDAFNVGYYAGFCVLSLGCVTYGCCWGIQLPQDTWYSTRYYAPEAKVLRVRPDLRGKALFPHSTLRGILFLKNAIIVMFIGTFFYVPGVFSSIFPVLNHYDKQIYYKYRGDSSNDDAGFHREENFRMVSPSEKKIHVTAWARVDKLFGSVSMMVALWCICTGKYNVQVNPFDAYTKASATPNFLFHCFVSGMVACLTFGYHYKRLGLWITPPHLPSE